jgi:CubicO group peptidase (beta-lactamase class C family)
MTAPSVVFPAKQWEQRSPQQMGLDPQFLDQLAAKTGGSGAVVRHGCLCYTWGDQQASHDWFSAAKPVLSTMLMFAVAEGKLGGVDDRVADWGWNFIEKDRAMTFRHLADMTSGYACAEEPGKAWGYNDYAIQLYGQTLDRVFGCPLGQAAADPSRLGALECASPTIFNCRYKHGVGLPVQDFARIGWLWLNRGRWGERQLLPRRLFDQHCRPDVPVDLPRTVSGKDSTNDYLPITSYGGGVNQTKNGPGIYGSNWWFNTLAPKAAALHWPAAPYDAFQANGLWGKYQTTMFPSMGLVVAAANSLWGKQQEPGDPEQPHNQAMKLVVAAVKD